MSAGEAAASQSAGIGTQYPGDVGIEKDPNVIFTEGFEEEIPTVGYDQVGGFYDLNGYPKEMRITDQEAAVGERSLELVHPAGVISPQWLHRKFSGQDTVYVRFYRKYEKDWVWPPNGAHETILFAGRYDNPASTGLSLYLDVSWLSRPGEASPFAPSPFPHPLLVLKSSFQGPSLDFGLNREIVSHVGWDNYYSLPYNVSPAPVLEGGRWYCFEYMAKMNSADSKDGEVRLWVDGQVITEMKGLLLRNASHRDIQWDHWMLGPRYGGRDPDGQNRGAPRAQKSWIDAIVVSRSYVGSAVDTEAQNRVMDAEQRR